MHRGLRGAASPAAALAAVRRRGWAQSVGEREPGVASVSAPVRPSGRPDRRGLGVRPDRAAHPPAGPAARPSRIRRRAAERGAAPQRRRIMWGGPMTPSRTIRVGDMDVPETHRAYRIDLALLQWRAGGLASAGDRTGHSLYRLRQYHLDPRAGPGAPGRRDVTRAAAPSGRRPRLAQLHQCLAVRRRGAGRRRRRAARHPG